MFCYNDVARLSKAIIYVPQRRATLTSNPEMML